MSFAFPVLVCSFIVSISFAAPRLSVAQSPPSAPASTEVNALAVALVRDKASEDQLLTQRKDLLNASLLVALKEQANAHIQKGDYVGAERISLIAIRIAERIGDQQALGTALCDLGSIYARQMNRTTESLGYLKKSLAIFEEAGSKRETARALHAFGAAYGLQRRHEMALEYYEKSLRLSEKVADRNLTALTLNGLGLSHTSLGRYELGLQFYEKARVLSEELNDKATLHIVLNNIATHYINQGRFAEALDYLHRSLRIIEELGSTSDQRSLAYKLQNIGLIYRRQGSLDQALAYSSRSLAILEEIGDRFGIANLQNNIGVIYKSQGFYDQALDWFQKSLRGYEDLQATPGIARCLNNIGDVYRLQGRFVEATGPLQRSLQLREQNRDRGGITLTLNNLALLYQDQGKYAEMLDVSRRSALLAEEINAPEDLWKAQDRIGRALRAMGRTSEARQSFVAAITTLESLRRHVAGSEQQQQSFFEDKLSPWLGMVELLVGQNQGFEALTFAEQSKARVLLEVLQPGRTNLRKSLSPEEQQAEQEKRRRLVSLNSQLTVELRREKPNSSLVTELKANVEQARLDYEDLDTRLYIAHPELRIQRGEAPIINNEELAALMPDASTALLEYVVTGDKIFLFVITKSANKPEPEIQVHSLPVTRKVLAKQTEDFRRQLAGRDLGFRALAITLYDILLKPAAPQLQGKTNLVIAPDDSLWDLPFQALLNNSNRFVIEDANVAYTPSLTVLREMKKRHGNPRALGHTTLLALGNPLLGKEIINRSAFTTRNEKLDPLPEAEEEVKTLKQLYGTGRSRVYIGAEAREDRFKNEAGQATILHFATHGALNNASPMYSHLALAQGDAKEDGLLEAWELMQLELNADLAVLSACETARGRIGAGEGMIGLSWAMFIAGVPAIVVSQWKVESAGTRELMVNFHRGLISRQVTANSAPRKTGALRQAALKLMRNAETSHPFYWAGFVLVGDGS